MIVLNKKVIKNSANLYSYCEEIYPPRFFDILYQNEEDI